MSAPIGPIDLAFSARIGVDVKGDLRPCIEVPGSVEYFGTGRTLKVAGAIDGHPIAITLLPTGSGGHMLSTTAKLRKTLGKGLGDEVEVHLTERLT